ncbi:MAG: sulfite exporter TauE/SafE family protein [Nitrososphaeraceae archaeon]
MLDIIIILVLIGLGGGVLGGLIGVGGGIIMTPALAFMGFPPYVIASSSLLAVTATSLSSNLTFIKKKYINYSLGLKLGVPAIPGSILGGFLTTDTSLDLFKILFAVLLVLVGIYIIFKNRIFNKSNFKVPKKFFYPLFIIGTFTAGIISSFFGIGGGIIFVPILVIIFQMKMINASPTSQFALLLSSSTGLITHIILENPEYIFGISLASGSFVGAQIGSKYLNRFKEELLRNIFSISLVFVAISLLLSL